MSERDATGGEEIASSPELPAFHRSTFEPPVTPSDGGASSSQGADDDALAAALAEELGRLTRTGAVPVPSTPAPSTSPSAPPVRQSLPDDALVSWIGEGATLEAMEQLEREMSLRQQDAEAFRSWEQSMVALGTPEALGAIEQARAGFADVIQSSVGETPTAPPAASPETSPAAPPAAPPATMPDSATELNAEQLADLALAPAPSSLPYADIPPPPGEGDPPIADIAEEAPEHVSTGIPELIEPFEPTEAESGTVPVSSDFDQFIAEAGLAEAVITQGTEAPDASHHGTGDAFPLAVYDPDEVVPATIDLVSPRAFRVELAGLEPSPMEQRVGRSARLFWIWFAANSSVISVGLGAVIFSLGVSLRQAVIATLVGVSISSLPLGIGALAGKRSGQPTMVVSRATFGLVGNILPALIAFLTRLFWGGVLLWLFTLGVTAVNERVGLLALESTTLGYAALGAAVLLAGVVAYFGYGLIARVQSVLTIVSSVLVVGFIMLSWPAVDVRAAMRVGDGEWLLVATGAVLVFSVLGLVWAMSSADVARYQQPSSSGAGSMLWSWAGAALPAFLLVGYGSLLAASDADLLTGLLEEPFETLTLLVPAMYVYPMLAVLGLGLLSGTVMTMYSGGFALQAMGLRLPRSIAVILVVVLTGAVSAGILVAVTGFDELVRDLATTLAVPVAAWAGVFSAELMMRSRRFHSPSLVHRGGVYPNARWINLTTLVLATALGFAFTDAAVSWLSWQGFGWGLVGFAPDSVMAGTDAGVVGALVLALLVTVVAGRPGITAQERDEQSASAGPRPSAAALEDSRPVALNRELD